MNKEDINMLLEACKKLVAAFEYEVRNTPPSTLYPELIEAIKAIDCVEKSLGLR